MIPEACEATIYSPDPQQCGRPAVELVGLTWMCNTHASAERWATAHQGDEPTADDLGIETGPDENRAP